MNKIWIIGILLLILAACTAPPTEKTEEPATTPEVKAPVTTETQPVKAPEEVKTPPPVEKLPSERTTPEPVVQPPKQEMSPQLKDLLKRADEKIQSVQYLYGGTSTNNLFLDTYFIKGTKMKIKKYSEDYYVREGYYDTIYVDLGIACCEERTRCLSHNVDNTNKKFEIEIEGLNIPKTPYQWTKEISADAQIAGIQTFNERSVTYIKYEKDGAKYEMWIDDTYGVPHKVLTTNANGDVIKYQYNDMKFNNLKDNDFIAPCN